MNATYAKLRRFPETDFYTRHQPLVTRTLSVSLTAARSKIIPADFAADHCTRSATAAIAAFDAGLTDELIDELETIKPHEISEQLTGGRDESGTT